MTEKLTELFRCMWRKEANQAIPQFKDASIIHLYEQKGNSLSVTTTDASLPY